MKYLRIFLNLVLVVLLISGLVIIGPATPGVKAQAQSQMGVSLSKTVSPDRIHAGDLVIYTINVTNESMMTIDVDIQDEILGFSEEDVRLYDGESCIYNLTFNPSEDITNMASANVSIIGGDIYIPPFLLSAAATVDVLNPAVKVTKTVSPTTVQLGEPVTYTITVTNSGDTWLTVDVTDDLLGIIADDMALDAGTMVTFEVTDTPVSSVTNTVMVTGTDEIGGTVSASDSAFVTVTGEDTTSPKITSKPQVILISPDSATIRWDTDELSNSTIIYGCRAGEYPLSVIDNGFVLEHLVVIDSLIPSTTYHFTAQSADVVGNSVSSRDITFSTLSEPDSTLPEISVSGPLSWQATTLILANASDANGIALVEFFVDGELVFTDYSSPYGFYADTSQYDNGPHTLTNKAIDVAGNSKQESATVDVVNLKDSADPTVIITAPVNNETISSKVTVKASLSDDTGLFKATMRIAKKGEIYSEWWGDWYPPLGATPTSTTAEFSLDSNSLDNGEYRLAVEVYDKDINYGVGSVDVIISNAPPLPPPSLVVSRTVTRTQNYYTITLKVKNTGGETATNVRLLDHLQLFQPIGKNTATASYSAVYKPELTSWNMDITSNMDIAAGQARTYTYNAVPVMIYPGSVTPMIGGDKYSPPGGSTRIWYGAVGGLNTYYDDVELLFSPTVPGTSYNEALSTSDYLIVTNPTNLLNSNAEADINQLLSSMAELAMLKNGVLGFLDVPPSYSRDFQAHDGFAVGDTLDDSKDEIVIGDMDRNLISTAHVPNQPLAISNTVSYEINWQEDWGFKCGNNEEGFDAGDQLAVGKMLGGAKDQIIMADESADKFLVYEGNGKLRWCYAIDNPVAFGNWDIEAFDGLVAGNLNGVGTEDLVFADRSENKIFILNLPLPDPILTPGFQITSYADIISEFSKDFEEHDGLAVGDVMGDAKEEIIVADRSADKIYIFSYTGTLMNQFSCVFDAGDGLATGNVIYTWPINKSEIIISDQDKDRIYVYQTDGKLISSISRKVEGFYGLAACKVHGGYVDEIIVADWSDDSLDIHNMTYATGSKYQLKELIKGDKGTGPFWSSNPVATGAWSKKLKSDWISNGYMLIVGETDIIPAWGGKTFGTVLTTRGNELLLADITDYPYASTYGEDIEPELSIGRIIGNTAQELRKPIEASINVKKGTPGYDFDRSNSFVISGYPAGLGGGADSIDFKSEALKNALTLKNNGIDSIYMHTPDYTKYKSNGVIDMQATATEITSKFFANTPGKDVIFLAGHGSGDHWDQISYYDVLYQANPFAGTFPFVFASSCSTGRYVHVYSVANAFLSRGSAVYMGATSWGLGSHQWISNYLYQSWDPGESIGLAAKQVKRSIGGYSVPAPMFGGGSSGYVVNQKERYWSAIYHVFGDPKFGIEGPPVSSLNSVRSALNETEPPSAVQIVVPSYEVQHLEDGDHLAIPGGGMVALEGFPDVPYYQTTYDYPAGYEIQDVVMTDRSSPIIEAGLEIPPVIISIGIDDDSVNTPTQPETPTGWWPDMPFTWNVIRGPETDTLVITIYPVKYNPSTSEIRFYQEYAFDINYLTSDIKITSLTTDRQFYPSGEIVNIELMLINQNEMSIGQDVVVSAMVRNEISKELVEGLPLLTLKNLRGTGSCSFDWDSTGIEPGSYIVEIEIHDPEGLLLENEVIGFTLAADFTSPKVAIIQPASGDIVTNGTTFLANAMDDLEVAEVYFHMIGVPESSDIESLNKGIPATLQSGTPQSGIWSLNFDTTELLDDSYFMVAEAVDSYGNTAWSEMITFSNRNWAVLELLPSSKKNKAGRTMPVKFSLRISETVDPEQPFVYNEDLEIRIYAASDPDTILQTSIYGDGSDNYRIDTGGELYITNFKTDKNPSLYIVEIRRTNIEFLVGSFSFETVK